MYGLLKPLYALVGFRDSTAPQPDASTQSIRVILHYLATVLAHIYAKTPHHGGVWVKVRLIGEVESGSAPYLDFGFCSE